MQATDTTPLITDRMLTKLAAPDYQASLGEWDDQTRALLATAIPEMAAELLKRRNGLCIAIPPEAAKQSLLRARDILRSPDPIHPRPLEDIENDGFITVHPTKQQFAGSVA